MLEAIIFTNAKGEHVTLGRTLPYILQYLEGSGGAVTDVQMQKAPLQDGATHIDTILEPRTLTFEVIIMADTQQQLFQCRQHLARIFNPKLGPGVLTYQFPGGAREIRATVDLAPVFPSTMGNKLPGFQKTMFTMICPSPFWEDSTEQDKEMAAWVGHFTFPLQLPALMGVQGPRMIFKNGGDVPTPLIIEFNGQASNPQVINHTTGETIRIKRDLGYGDRLLINTSFGQKRVEINGANAFHWLDLASSFWQLMPGDNDVEYKTDGTQDNARVRLRWRSRYSGV